MAELFTSTKGERLRALILAAGFGSRLMPLTKDKPKCMVEYEGRSIIDYEIEALRACGVDEIAVVGGYLYPVLESYLASKHGISTMYENPNYASTNMVQTMLCAREWIESCAREKQDLIISYADIVYFAPCVRELCKSSAPLAIAIDKQWHRLWQMRFSDVLLDAESLKICDGKITELGKKPKSLDEIQGQYMGLFKYSHTFLPKMLAFYDGLDRGAIYDGKDFANMYMTSFLQGLIDAFGSAQAVEVYGGWLEVDMPSDLAIPLRDIQADKGASQELLEQVARIAVQAGEIALSCSKDCAKKLDGSPVTKADLEANAFITQALRQISPYQVCSEEAVLAYEVRKGLEYFWLVDPLDGTKDFIANRTGWSVNIALIHQGRAILGVVYAPALKELYVGLEGFGARSYEVDSSSLQGFRLDSGVKLCGGRESSKKDSKQVESSLLACDSLFHSSVQTQKFIAHYGLARIELGSSLKFCALAQGSADIYPRFNGTKEWDTAASQVILEQSGGAIISIRTQKPLRYNKKQLANDYFVAFSANQVGGKIYDDVCSNNLPLACRASFYGLVVWITGLAGSGKSTIGKELYTQLRDSSSNVVYLDGDELRDVLGAYSYDKQGRISVAKKRADLARLLSRQGIITIVSTISMFDEVYAYNRAHFPNYLEVYISCAYDELITRDQKQLYSKALKGELANVVGVDIEFDEPQAHLHIDNTAYGNLGEKVGQILAMIESKR